MDGERMEDEDRDAIASLSSVPPPRKIHSYSQQLRGPSSSHKKGRQIRKHSLDDDRIPSNIDQFCTNRSSSDEDADDFFPYSSTATPNCVDSDYVSHKVATGGDASTREDLHPMPEFVASGGGAGIFRVPPRSAVHPSRPPCLELRPHPLKETQVGKFLRNIACTDTQLWAGQESGLRVWDLEKVFEVGSGLGGRTRRGDEDATPFHESVTTSPTMCLIVDSGNRLVWTGHKDGKIRSWKMDQPMEHDAPFKEGLSWQAHRGPVLSMAMTPFGKRRD